MKYGKRFLVLIFAILLTAGTFAASASAQNRGVFIRRVPQRSVIVRRYFVRDPFWRYNRWRSPYWGYSSFYDPYWNDPYWNDPYLNYQRQKFYLERELSGDRRELQKHERKYRADGYISPKEREELADDRRDIQKAIEKLNKFNRNY